MSQLRQAYLAYVRAANTPDEETRVLRMSEAAAGDFVLTSVDYEAIGRSAVAAELGARMAAMPTPITLAAEVIDGHHDVLRATWTARDAEGATVASGLHVALGMDVLQHLYVFVDQAAPVADTDGEAR